MDTKEKWVKLTKIAAIKYADNDHPNNINTGYVREGIALVDLEVGNSMIVTSTYKLFYTSTVISIDEENMTFDTEIANIK